MEEDNKADQKVSKYNAALAQLYRLNDLWVFCQQHRRNRNYITLNIELDSIWAELSEDCDETDTKLYLKHNKLISQHKKNVVFLNQVLLNKEIFLRRLQNKQGKSSTYFDTSEEDFEA